MPERQSLDPSRDSVQGGGGGMTLESEAEAVGNPGADSSQRGADDPSRDSVQGGGGGMTLESEAEAVGNPGAVSSQGSADGGGGMSSSQDTSMSGNPGPDHSQGPSARDQAYEEGRHDQEVEDREPLQREDPVNSAIWAVLSRGETLVHELSNYLSDKAVERSRDEPDHSSSDVNIDDAPSDLPDATVPDATVQYDPSQDAGAIDSSQQYDPSQDAGANDSSQQNDTGQDAGAGSFSQQSDDLNQSVDPNYSDPQSADRQ